MEPGTRQESQGVGGAVLQVLDEGSCIKYVQSGLGYLSRQQQRVAGEKQENERKTGARERDHKALGITSGDTTIYCCTSYLQVSYGYHTSTAVQFIYIVSYHPLFFFATLRFASFSGGCCWVGLPGASLLLRLR